MKNTSIPACKPGPAHPDLRQVELPWCCPKSEHDDPRAPALIDAIMRNDAYRLADEDVAFLRRPDTRGLRMQLDYMKAESLLEGYGIRHSVVVFGSTRVPEPRAARRKVAELERARRNTPGDKEIEGALAVAKRILDKSRYYEVAQEFGRILGREYGADGSLALVTGGGPGLMEAANRGAHDEGAPNIGFNIDLPHEQFPNPYLSPGYCFRFHYFAMRKLHFLLRARALVVFPGGFGTLDELFETLTLIQTRKIAPVPVILVGEAYWRRVFDPEFLVEEGVIEAEDRNLFWFAETAEEIWEDIQRWYRQAGKPIAG